MRRCGDSMWPMRKLIAMALLALLGLPFAAPLLAMSAEHAERLPACCRKDGKHHCMMSMDELARAMGDAPHMSAPVEHCPYAPTAAMVMPVSVVAPPSAAAAIYAGVVAHPAVVAQTACMRRVAETRSRQKRGPPAMFSL